VVFQAQALKGEVLTRGPELTFIERGTALRVVGAILSNDLLKSSLFPLTHGIVAWSLADDVRF